VKNMFGGLLLAGHFIREKIQENNKFCDHFVVDIVLLMC